MAMHVLMDRLYPYRLSYRALVQSLWTALGSLWAAFSPHLDAIRCVKGDRYTSYLYAYL
jgi:hypothetical protein